ncbi:MAG: flagellar basal-body rod protein FlgG [Deltaproteobacteria bacterium]|nr:MAG: flagellar basal-body rod protein FlgG [Deltaproteobacteria bacterium]
MMRALNTAASGMAAQEAVVNTIANNIANLSTIGFKKSRAETDDLNYQTIIEQGARTNSDTFHNVGVQIGSGAKVSAVRKHFTQGEPNITNNPFDLMINGDGFFGIVMPNGNLKYTRDGAFNLNAEGRIVNKNGYALFPDLNFPQGTIQVNVSDSGQVDAYLNGQQEPINLGIISLFTFINPVGLKSLGQNLYEATVASGAPAQLVPKTSNAGSIMQGALENSNVNIMTEMTELIRAQRAYEMNSKVMGIADKMLQTVNNIR